MVSFTTLALAVAGVSFMTFVTFFGRLPALRRTPIAWLHRFIWVIFPNGILSLDRRLTSGKLTEACTRFGRFILHDRHPTILVRNPLLNYHPQAIHSQKLTYIPQIFFIVLLLGGEVLYLPTAWPLLGPFQKFTGAIAIILPYVFLYLSAAGDPGYITPANLSHEMARYPYDFTIFHPGADCYTCHLRKPARSKHCSICKRCIAKFDHHCVFINNCVGAGNHHWFMLLLLTTGILTSYGGFLGLHLIASKARSHFPFWALLPWNANNGAGIELRQWLIIWGWGLRTGVAMGAVTLLALMTSPLVWGLLGYHMWLIYCGTTTNESMKWEDWQAEMNDGFAFKRKMPADRVKNLEMEAAWTRWPAETEQILVRTGDGQPPQAACPLAGVGEWERVWRLKDIENLYDLGFWDNLVDVFFPNHSFRDPQTPAAEARIRRKKRGKARR
ncbi:hypothetical protein OQA88_9003 [Cercophora sp. LCS_1]